MKLGGGNGVPTVQESVARAWQKQQQECERLRGTVQGSHVEAKGPGQRVAAAWRTGQLKSQEPS